MLRGLKRALVASTVAVYVTSAAPARAGSREEADALFREGRRAAVAGDYAKACPKFSESQRLDPSAGTLVNLGDCEEHLGHLLAARNYLRAALAQLGQSDPRFAVATGGIARIEALLPTLSIRLSPSASRDSRVLLDGVAVDAAQLGARERVEAGEHAILVEATGHAPRKFTLTLAPGERRELEVAPGAPNAVGPPALGAVPVQAHAEPSSSPNRTAGWVALGAGAIGLGVAGVSGAVVLGAHSIVRDGCSTTTRICNTQDGADAAARGHSWIIVNTVSAIVGVVGVGVGTYLLLSAQSSKPARADVGATWLPGGAALVARGTF